MQDAHTGGAANVKPRVVDDGSLADELQKQVYSGDPEDGGVVW
jgi:hypothetical protein